MTEWLSIENFYEEENEARNGTIDKKLLYEICEKYGFVKASRKWEQTKNVKTVPNLRNGKLHKNKIDISSFFDHFYSFKTVDGRVYWAVCPYDKGMNHVEIENAFFDNYMPCKVLDGFYGNVTILLDPENIIKAQYDYELIYHKNKHKILKHSNIFIQKSSFIYSSNDIDEAIDYMDNYINDMLYNSNINQLN